MIGLEIVVVLGVAILVCTGLASRIGIAPPTQLLHTGVLISFVPGLQQARLHPEDVLFLSRPAPLFGGSQTTFPRQIEPILRVVS
jgi:hypothetical protein